MIRIADAEPVSWGSYKVYTSQSARGWRVLKQGSKDEKKFSWASDPRASWRELQNYLRRLC